MDNYRKPLTPLQIPSPSQFLLTTTTTNPTTTNTTTIPSASVPLDLVHNNNNYNNYQSMQPIEQPEIRRLSNDEHQEYRNIINDLTNELVDLTSQVSLVQNKFDNTDTVKPFEKTLKEFELQNDLLQKTIQALEMSNADKDKIIADQTTNQKELRHKISNFESTVSKNTNPVVRKLLENIQNYTEQIKNFQIKCTCGASKLFGSPIERAKSGGEYQNLFELLEQKTKELHKLQEQTCSDKTALKKRILDLEEENKRYDIKISGLNDVVNKKDCILDDMEAKLKKMAFTKVTEDIILNLKGDLEKGKKTHREQLLKVKSEMEMLRKNLDEQIYSFTKQTETLIQLEKQIAKYRTQCETSQKENATLQDEVFSLKERLASSEGTERSLKEQIYKSQEELVNAKCDLQKINAYSEEIDSFKKHNSSLKENYYKIAEKFNQLTDEYNALQENSIKIYEINRLQKQELQCFRKWKLDQAETDKMNEEKLEQMCEHIRLLTNDREKLIENCNDMYKDTYVLGSMLEKYKEDFESGFSAPTKNSPQQVMNMLQKTATKLHHTRKAWTEQLNERQNSE